MKTVSFDHLVTTIFIRGGSSRTLTAIAGPPASGKSTIAVEIADALNELEAGCAAVIGMDGYHFDDLVLVPRGLRSRKGAPDTFDVHGFSHMLGRLKANAEAEIAIPVFDRSIEIARAGAHMIPRSVRRLVVEGNYLLLGDEPWCSLRSHFETTVWISCDEGELRRRLEERWKALPPGEREAKIDGNDLPNARAIVERSAPAEFTVARG